jgi:hypothetical protein
MTQRIRTTGRNPRVYAVGEEGIRPNGTPKGASMGTISAIDKTPENFVLRLPNSGCALIPRRNAEEA